MIDVNELRRLVAYDAVTGVFTANFSAGNVKAGSVRGNPDSVGYLRFMINGRQYLCHVLAWIYVYGEPPEGGIDHINGMHGDNRISNLRCVTHSQNVHNKPIWAMSGVTKKSNKYRARISGKYLGYFDTPQQAHQAYCDAKQIAAGVSLRKIKEIAEWK